VGPEIVPVIFFAMVGLIVVSFSPLGRAFARRIAGESRPARDDAEIEALQSDVAQLRRELDECRTGSTSPSGCWRSQGARAARPKER